MLKKIAFWLVFLTLYFNIGWGLGYYVHFNLDANTFESAPWHAKLLAGHCALFEKEAYKIELSKKRGALQTEIIFSLIWPIVLFISLCGWVGHFVWWTLKFIFAGGFFKLVFGIP